MGNVLALRGATVIDGSGGAPVERASVIVADDVITWAGPDDRTPDRAWDREIDCAGMVIMPGIIESHVHLGGASMMTEDEWVLEPDIAQSIASVAQARALLECGVTSARDISVHGPHLRKAIAKGLIQGPRIVPCWRGLSRTGGHGDGGLLSPPDLVERSHPWGIVADGVDEIRKVTRLIIKNGSRCIKVWASGGGTSEEESEDMRHYTYEELQVMVEEADCVGLPVAAHCECAEVAKDAARAGVWSIEHGEQLDEETIAIMAAKGISVVPTLALLFKWFDWSGDEGYYKKTPYVPGGGELPVDMASLRALHRKRLADNLMAAHDAGIRIGVGSDSFCTDMTPYGPQTLEDANLLVEAGLTEMEALVAATRSGAEILRVDSVTGTLEAGKAADILILTKDPLADIANLAVENIALVMKEGLIVKSVF
jgi:imidazolonepropionase-like amidohydrolase